MEHIESTDKVDEELSREFGFLLVKITNVLKEVLRVKLVYVYIFGDHIPHLHAHLAPHSVGDYLYSDIARPEVSFPEDLLTERELDNLTQSHQRMMG